MEALPDDNQAAADIIKNDPPKTPPKDGIQFPPKPSANITPSAQSSVAELAGRFNSKSVEKSVSAPVIVSIPADAKSELDPTLTKYMKMMKMKIPKQSVLN